MMMKIAFANQIRSGLSTIGKSINNFGSTKVKPFVTKTGDRAQNLWQNKAKPFLHDVGGKDVRNLDNKIKNLTHEANIVGHDTYTAASKELWGRDFMPGHEKYRMKKVLENPIYKGQMNTMEGFQEQRKELSKKRNRARLKFGLGVAVPTAAVAGGVALKNHLDKKKKEKEEEDMFYKSASVKDTAKKIKSGIKNFGIVTKGAAKATGSQIKQNFAHAPETNYIYEGSKKQRLKDIATFARVRELNNVLSYGKDGTYSEIPSDNFAKLNRHIRSFNAADAESKRLTRAINKQKSKIGHRTDLDTLVGQSRKAFSDNGERTNPKNNRPVGYVRKTTSSGNVYDRDAINKNIRQMTDAKEKFKNDAENVLKYIDDRFNDTKKTRNNELAKSVALYAIPATALTLGGTYIYKRHKKKQAEKDKKNISEQN